MNKRILVEWGKWCHYILPQLTDPDWSGNVSVKGGRLYNPQLVTYQYPQAFGGWYGPFLEKRTPVDSPEWDWTEIISMQPAYNQMGGMVFDIEAESHAVITVTTRIKTVSVTLGELLKEKLVTFHVGDKYSCDDIRIKLDGYNPLGMNEENLKALKRWNEFSMLFLPGTMKNGLGTRCWFRTETAWSDSLNPLEMDFDKSVEVLNETNGIEVLAQVQIARKHGPDILPEDIEEEAGTGSVHIEFALNGKIIHEEIRKFFAIRGVIPILEEINFHIDKELLESKNRLEMRVSDADFFLITTYVLFKERENKQFEPLLLPSPGDPVYIGFDTVQLPHDQISEFIEKACREQYANFIYFRIDYISNPSDEELKPLSEQWAVLLSKYKLKAVVMSNPFARIPFSKIRAYIGDSCLGLLMQEYDGDLFGYKRLEEQKFQHLLDRIDATMHTRTMKQAEDEYVSFLKFWWDKDRPDRKTPVVATFSVIGSRYGHKAGVSLSFAQLNKSHNMLLMADIRGAAKEFGDKQWGCHIAENSAKNPTGEEDFRMWYLALYISYFSGAKFIYDEESLHKTWFDRLYSESDYYPVKKRKMLSAFFKFTRFHSRKGEKIINFAVMPGRHSLDCADGIEYYGAKEQELKVWGTFGGVQEKWRYSEPEYGYELVKLLYPMAYTQSLRGNPSPSRKWWSGTPYGECDFISAEAPSELLENYSFAFMPGWNTMTASCYRELKRYVESGGEAFLSLPQFATNQDRDFLSMPESMALINGGNLSELCGVKVRGKGSVTKSVISRFGGREKTYSVESQSYAGHRPVNSAIIENLGAEILAYDKFSYEPLLVKNRIGKGCIYLLTTYNYQGNTRIRNFVSDFMKWKMVCHAPIKMEGDTDDVYYAYYRENESGIHRLYFINTDWTEKGNVKEFCFSCGSFSRVPVKLREGEVISFIIMEELMIKHEELFFFVSGVRKTNGKYEISMLGEKRKSIVCSFSGRARKDKTCEIIFDKGWTKKILI